MTRRNDRSGGSRRPMPGAAITHPAPAADPLAASYLKALGLHRAGRLREAGQAYRQILTIHGRHIDAADALAMLMHQTGRTAEAEPLLRSALTVAPDDARLLAHLGLLLLALDRPDEALRVERAALKRAQL